jgi:EmrB/QacA subfamily drug resistance transporter
MRSAGVALDSARGRLVVAATVLGSGVVFLESTVVNVALPSMAEDLDLGMAGLQWILDGYLLTLSALILMGGSLGDAFGRGRIFVLGLLAFGVASALAAFMPDATSLVFVRLLQGAAGALLVPNSLAVLETVFEGADRGRAIGQWAGWSAASTALGPLAGGWIIDATSWRWVFGVVAPIAFIAAAIGIRAIPSVQINKGQGKRIDVPGALLATTGLAGITTALIVGPIRTFTDPLVVACGVGGVLVLVWFVWYEKRAEHAMLPLSMFRSHDFVGTNAATLFIYAALSGVFFLLMLQLQEGLGYSALQAGASLLPINVLMVMLSPMAGRLATRWGARWLIAVGAAFCAGGSLLFMTVKPGAMYTMTVLPAASLFGLGLATLVAPLTAAMMASADDELKGVASAFNNAVARVAGLLAIVLIPIVAGIAGSNDVRAVGRGFATAMAICAGLCLTGGVFALKTVSRDRKP